MASSQLLCISVHGRVGLAELSVQLPQEPDSRDGVGITFTCRAPWGFWQYVRRRFIGGCDAWGKKIGIAVWEVVQVLLSHELTEKKWRVQKREKVVGTEKKWKVQRRGSGYREEVESTEKLACIHCELSKLMFRTFSNLYFSVLCSLSM